MQTLSTSRQIVINYQSRAHRWCSVASSISFPIWGAVCPVICILSFLMSFLYGLKLFIYLTFPVLFMLIGFAITLFALDQQLVISKEGMRFPLLFSPVLRLRSQRRWDDLSRVFLSGNKQERICFLYRSGGAVSLDLTKVKASDLEKMLLAIDGWGHTAEKDPQLKELANKLMDDQSSMQAPSYTKIWESAINQKFASTAFVPLEPGKLLQKGRLKVVRQLAFGGLSAIYLCHLDRKESVILKECMVPDLDQERRQKAEQMFVREASILMKLDHPRIAKLRDNFVENGRVYVLLDYIPGADLRQIVSQVGPQPEAKVLKWSKQIAEVLLYLHEQEPPIMHRDVSPDNIVIGKGDSAFLIDFGAANEFIGRATGTLVGKQSYMSPEQLRGETVPQSDIYGLGATMYFMLSGEDPEPLTQSAPAAAAANGGRGNIFVTTEMDLLVRDCTTFDTETRIASAKEFLERLKRLEMAGSSRL